MNSRFIYYSYSLFSFWCCSQNIPPCWSQWEQFSDGPHAERESRKTCPTNTTNSSWRRLSSSSVRRAGGTLGALSQDFTDEFWVLTTCRDCLFAKHRWGVAKYQGKGRNDSIPSVVLLYIREAWRNDSKLKHRPQRSSSRFKNVQMSTRLWNISAADLKQRQRRLSF